MVLESKRKQTDVASSLGLNANVLNRWVHEYKDNGKVGHKGNCRDNAVIESFFHTLKTECVYFENYKTREEDKKSVFEYIERFTIACEFILRLAMFHRRVTKPPHSKNVLNFDSEFRGWDHCEILPTHVK